MASTPAGAAAGLSRGRGSGRVFRRKHSLLCSVQFVRLLRTVLTDTSGLTEDRSGQLGAPGFEVALLGVAGLHGKQQPADLVDLSQGIPFDRRAPTTAEWRAEAV
jgi:hypothetical protein